MKKLLISLVAAFALIGVVYGSAASLSVNGTDHLGSGVNAVDMPDGTLTVTDMAWSLDKNDTSKVDGVDVSIFNNVFPDETCSVSATVYDDDGSPLGAGTTAAKDNNIEGNTTTVVNVHLDSAQSSHPAAEEVVSISVTLVCVDGEGEGEGEF